MKSAGACDSPAEFITSNGVDAKIYCSELVFREHYKLPEYCRILQAEVFLDGKAAEIANNAVNN